MRPPVKSIAYYEKLIRREALKGDGVTVGVTIRRFSVRRLRRAQKIATAEREFRLGLLRSTETGKNKEAARREIRSDGRPLASLLDGVVDEGVGLLSLILRLSTHGPCRSGPASTGAMGPVGLLSQLAPILRCHALQWASESAERVWRRIGLAGPAGLVQPQTMRPFARLLRARPRCRGLER